MNRRLLFVLTIVLAIVSVSVVSAGLFGGNTINVNGIDFNVPDGFENGTLPDDPGFVDVEKAVLLEDSSIENFVMIEVNDKLPEVPKNMIDESEAKDINGKQGTFNSLNVKSFGKDCHFFDYEQDNKKVRVVVFTDDDEEDLLKSVIG